MLKQNSETTSWILNQREQENEGADNLDVLNDFTDFVLIH